MVLCKPIYMESLRNQLPTRWKVVKKPDRSLRRSLSSNFQGKVGKFRNTLSASDIREQSPKPARSRPSSPKANRLSIGRSMSSPMEGILGTDPDSDLIQNTYFVLAGWESWALLSKMYSNYRFYILLCDVSLAHRLQLGVPGGAQRRRRAASKLVKSLGNLTGSSQKFDFTPASVGSTQLYRVVARAETYDEILQDWNLIMADILPHIENAEEEPSVYKIENMIKELRTEQCTSEVTISEEGDFMLSHVKYYRIVRSIGKGTFGDIKLAEHEETGRQVALKLVVQTEKNSSLVAKETSILIGLHHPHVMRLHELIDKDEYMALVVEHCPGGSLRDLLEDGPPPEDRARRIIFEISLGVQYLHHELVVHRDLKPDNVLLDSAGRVKIADFNCAARLPFRNSKLSDIVGTLVYAAPEIIKIEYLGQPVDIWSLGVTLFEILVGHVPFAHRGEDVMDFLERVATEKPGLPDELSEGVRGVLKGMLDPEPLLRLNIDKVLKAKWFAEEKQAYDVSIKSNVHSSKEDRQKYLKIAEDAVQELVNECEEVLCWNLLTTDTKNDCQHFSKEGDGVSFALMTKGLIRFPKEEFIQVRKQGLFRDSVTYKTSVVETLDDYTEIMHSHSNVPIKPTASSEQLSYDFCVLNAIRHLPDGRMAILMKSVDHPDCPMQTRVLRSYIKLIGYLIEPLQKDACIVKGVFMFDFLTPIEPAQSSEICDELLGNIPRLRRVLMARKLDETSPSAVFLPIM